MPRDAKNASTSICVKSKSDVSLVVVEALVPPVPGVNVLGGGVGSVVGGGVVGTCGPVLVSPAYAPTVRVQAITRGMVKALILFILSSVSSSGRADKAS